MKLSIKKHLIKSITQILFEIGDTNPALKRKLLRMLRALEKEGKK